MEFNEVIKEIKNRISITEKIGQTVKLKKSGLSFIGLCPFHEEKTPSFHVFPKENRYYCFGCKAHGDVIDFLVEKDSLSWNEAIVQLANECGLELPKTKNTKTTEENIINNRILTLNKLMVGMFRVQLFSNKEAKPNEGLQYLYERGITNETINSFNLGYCRTSDELLSYLQKNYGFTESELVESGSFIRTNNGRIRCNFEGRIIFPIRNIKGEYVAFGSRRITEAVQPKYINSSTSTVFEKNKSLYGLYEGSQAIRNLDAVVVVEGFIDVLMAHQNGFKNVVAAMGTAFGEGHVNLIKRYTNNIILAFDNDKAGQLAAFKAIDIAKENFGTKLSAKVDSRGILKVGESTDANIRIAKYPESYDADETFRNLGSQGWIDTMNKAMSVVEYHIESIEHSEVFNIKDATKVANKILPLIAEVKSPIERDTYIRKLASNLLLSETSIRAEVSKLARLANGKTPLQVLPGKLEVISPPEVFEDIVMANLIKYFPVSLYVKSNDETTVLGSDFNNELNTILFTKLNEFAQSNFSLSDIKSSFPDMETAKHFSNLLSYCESIPKLEGDEIIESIKFLINKLRYNQFLKVYNQIADELNNSSNVYSEGYTELVEAVVGIEQLMKVYCR